MTKAPRRIAVLGTGIMGGPMATRLADAGFSVTVWNRTIEKASVLQAAGITVAASAGEAVAEADIVICMLSSGPVCENVLMTPGGVIDQMQPGATLIVMSSIPVETAIAIVKAALEKRINTVDAPVSGGEKGAKEGTLAIMAGGEAIVVDALADVFLPLGLVTHVGPSGSGALTKLANQLIVATTICAVAEALTLAESGGADPVKVREALLGGFADSTVLRQHGLRMVQGDFMPGGPAKYQVKDTSTAMQFAKGRGLTLPVSLEVDKLFRAMVDHGDGDLDHSGIILELRRKNML
ncbi:NAD(P)-dependent oxidoreductase [Oryzifoliimicrobium ureilyticus]|uniref:NAD(P)-dependent oxidoreductase n=1 Tax=Oryzifoliimicrobium ureilyticus TaxID=3113724 RepID=UPI0030762109